MSRVWWSLSRLKCLFRIVLVVFIFLAQLPLVSSAESGYKVTPSPEPVSNHTLYFASNGWKAGIHTYVGGLYGGVIQVKDHGDARNMSQTKLECFFSTGGPVIIQQDYLQTRGMAFDPVGTDVLFHILDSQRLSVYLFPRCHFGDMCNYTAIRKNSKYQARTLFSFSTNMDRSSVCRTEVNPFGLYDYNTYFVAKRHIKTTVRLELRKLVGCEYEQFHSQNPFQIDRCSLLIHTLYETDPVRCDYLKMTNNILVLEHEDHKYYLVQILNRTDTSFEVTLVVASKQGPVRYLHTEPLPYSYHEITDDGRHLGGISYKDGKLCWSAVTRILCADWDVLGDLTNVESVLDPWEAANTICFVGSDVPRELSNITTGVTIVKYDPDDGLFLYFGCQQQVTKYGGAGLLRMLPETGAPVLFPVQQRFKKIHAGTLFLTKTCDPSTSGTPGVTPGGTILTLGATIFTTILRRTSNSV